MSFMANICCSFEMEPRTLSQGQLNQAREVAAGVAQNLELSEASTLFSEGLTHDARKEVKQMGENGEQVQKMKFDNYCREQNGEAVDEKACQCLCRTATTESPDHNINLKEPLSATF